jgi:L-iditol 2-dehydrogenase
MSAPSEIRDLPSDMLAARFYAPRDVRFERVPLPVPGTGEVLVRVLAATTCGTDVKAFRRGHPVLLGPPPAPFGHEYCGEVVAVGAVAVGAVAERWRPGTRVVGANSAPCGICFYCQRARESLCEALQLWNGAYAEYALIPAAIVARNLYALPAAADPLAVAMAEPLACALHAVEDAGVREGDSVAIIGSGPLGLLLLAAAHLRGAHVVLTGHGAARLALARAWGAETVLDTSETGAGDAQAAAIRAHANGGRGADVVFEAVGRVETWQTAVAATRPGGVADFFGGCPSGSSAAFETYGIHYEERTLKGTFHHTPRHFAAAVDAVTSGAVRTRDLISDQVPLGRLLDVFAALERGDGIKYAICPDDVDSAPGQNAGKLP